MKFPTTLSLRFLPLAATALLNFSAARAATIAVNSAADPAGFNNAITIAQLGATVTLRDAINAARNTGGTHTITFAPGLAGQTIYVANWDPTISWTGFRIDGQSFSGAPHTPFNLTIQGLTGNSGVTIARDTVNATMGFFYVGDSDTVATFNDLTFADANLAGIGSNGGAFDIFGATVNMNRCTLRNNQANSGGAIVINSGTLNATNCTLSGNYANYGGGAIYKAGGVVNLTHTTITNNATSTTGAGLYNPSGADLLVNTLIAGNVHGQDIGGGTVSSSSHHNLIGDAGNAGGLVNGVNGNIVGANPLLNGLANNGGPTQTAALAGNSPALNAAANGFASTDQRGVSRPQDFTADIGAYEYVPTAPTAFSSSASTTFASNNTNSFTVTANGAPPPRYSVNGTLPTGVTLTAAGLLSGNPPAGSEGTYPLTITASNSAGTIMQSFTLKVISALLVTTTIDEDNGSANPALGTGTSLREAINFANTQASPATITFAPSLAGQTINLTINGAAANDPVALPIGSNRNITIQGLTGSSGVIIRCGAGFQAHIFYAHTGATLTLNDLTLANGFAYFGGGAVVSNGVIQMNRCTLRDNYGGTNGGAIWSGGIGSSQQISLTNCTLVNNQADDGGAIYAASTTTVILTNVTVSRNTGGGLSTGGNATVMNTIIAGNTKGGNPSDVTGSNLNSSSHHNLIGTGGSGGLVNGVNGNIVGVADAKLGSLASNGGPTQTTALLTSSPAIDAGAAVNGVTSDQRGLARPQGGAPDIGAFETVVAPLVTLNPQDQTVSLGGTATFIALANYLNSGTAPSTLATGASLLPGQYLLSPNRAYQLLYQNDGNLVLYRGDGVAMWASGTGGKIPDHVIMQTDGNLVIYGPGGVAQWATGTSGNSATLTLQNDGNLVIYTSVAIWATSTAQYASFNPVPTVQWQVSTDHGGTFTNIAGATDITLNVTPSLADNGKLYRATFTNASGTVGTAAATLTVNELPSLVVTTVSDTANSSDGQTSLREAIAYAGSSGGAQTVTFAPSLSGQMITLSSGWNNASDDTALRLPDNVTIDGSSLATPVTLVIPQGTQRRHFLSGGPMTLRNLILSGGNLQGLNDGGAVWSTGAVTLEGVQFTNNKANYGGAVKSAGSGTVTIRNCTFNGNYAQYDGGATHASGVSSTIENSTFSGNSTGSVASAIGGSAQQNTYRFLTVTNNSGGAAAIDNYQYPTTIVNSIVDGNSPDGIIQLAGGTVTAQSTNNIFGSNGTGGLTNGVNGNLTNVPIAQLLLGSLGNNGGPTQTIAISAGSVAVDAGVAIAGLTTDQRGLVRPQGSAVDIGAFELAQTQAANIPIIGPLGGTYQNSVQVSITGTSTNSLVRYTVDGSTPSSSNGLIYSGPFTLTRGTAAIKAIAYGHGWLDSPVASTSYTVLVPLAYWRNLQGLAADGSQDLLNPSHDGVANLLKYAFNLAANAGDLNRPNAVTLPANGTAGLPRVRYDGQGRLTMQFVRRKAASNAGIAYIVESSPDLLNWSALDLTNASVASVDGTWERVTVTDPTVAAKRFGRVRLFTLDAYFNDFNAALGPATLYGTAAWTNAAVQLTDALNGVTGSVIFNGVTLDSYNSGFAARFNLQLGPTTTGVPADGASFAVGTLPNAPWDESGPSGSHSIAIGFDTYDNGGNGSIGIHLWVNGTHVASNPLNPFTDGAPVPVEVSYDATSGVTMKFNGITVFNDVPISGFSFQPNDRFGFGARTGGANERAIVDDVEITPR